MMHEGWVIRDNSGSEREQLKIPDLLKDAWAGLRQSA